MLLTLLRRLGKETLSVSSDKPATVSVVRSSPVRRDSPTGHRAQSSGRSSPAHTIASPLPDGKGTLLTSAISQRLPQSFCLFRASVSPTGRRAPDILTLCSTIGSNHSGSDRPSRSKFRGRWSSSSVPLEATTRAHDRSVSLLSGRSVSPTNLRFALSSDEPVAPDYEAVFSRRRSSKRPPATER